MRFTASPAGGRITPLPSNEFYQSPFDGRWVDVDEAEVFRLIDMQRERIFGTHGKAVPVDGKCGKLKMHETKLIEFNPTKNRLRVRHGIPLMGSVRHACG